MTKTSPRPQPPEPSTAPPLNAERTKVLSVRLSADEFERLTALATEIGVGPSTLTRTLIRRGLSFERDHHVEQALSPIERGHMERLEMDRLTARVVALETWVASHATDHAT